MKRRARPTSEGLAVLGLTVAIGAVGAASGNNLLYLLVGSLIGLWGIEIVLGSWNLRGVDAVRRLPAELVAEGDGSGRIVVRNRRRWMSAVALLVRDLGTQTEVSIDEVDTGSTGGRPAVWRFPRRGAVQLKALEIRSRFPFGWIEQQVTVPAPAELVVYPRASTGVPGARRTRLEAVLATLRDCVRTPVVIGCTRCTGPRRPALAS